MWSGCHYERFTDLVQPIIYGVIEAESLYSYRDKLFLEGSKDWLGFS